MKFRSVFKRKMLESYFAPLLLGVSFFAISHKFMRLYNHRQGFFRMLKLCMSVGVGMMGYIFINTFPWPNKQIHDLVTQPEPNGQYVRNILKSNFPRHWSMISKKLYTQGYNFREMNEYSEKIDMPDVTDKYDTSVY
jgi:hypothetical protein